MCCSRKSQYASCARQVANGVVDPVDPIAIVEVFGTDEVSAGEKAGNETDLLPRAALFASS